MSAAADITAIITGHREGLLAGPSLNSFWASVAHARARGLSVQPIAVLDRADAVTRGDFCRPGGAWA